MSVEILSVSLSDESIERIAQRVAQLTGGGGVSYSPVASSPQTSQPAPGPASQPQGDDPWATATPAAQYQGQQVQHTQNAPQQPAQQYQAPQGGYQQQHPPVCAHGPMKFIQAGSRDGRSWPAYYACDTPRGTPGKCKSVNV